MSRVIFGEAAPPQHFLISASKQPKITTSGHDVYFVEPRNKPENENSVLLTLRVIPNNTYAGFYLDLDKNKIKELKAHVDKAYELSLTIPEQKKEKLVAIPKAKAAAAKAVATKKKTATKKKPATKKVAVKKKAVKKKAVKKVARKRPATRR